MQVANMMLDDMTEVMLQMMPMCHGNLAAVTDRFFKGESTTLMQTKYLMPKNDDYFYMDP
jgi:hypothetical protein